jgi:tetratricopeptide (TPR) repeat protein
MLAGSLAVYLCALLSKEEAVAVPCLLLVYELCRHRFRIDTKKAVNIFLVLLPFLLLTVGFIAFVTIGLRIISDTPQPRGVWENLLTQARSMFLYLKFMAFPANLSIDHEVGAFSSILEPAAMASVIGAVAMLAGSLLFVRRAPVVPFGVWWFAFALAPSSTLVALKLIMNEQRMYIAAIGIMFIAGAGFADALERAAVANANGKRRALVCGFALVLIILAALTVHRNTQWRTPLSIWANALENYPASRRANTQVADIYLRMGRHEDALKAAKKAVEVGPNIVEARSVLASVYSKMGLQHEALVEARAAVDLKPNSSDAQTALGTVYARLERFQEAEAAWKRALEINPQNDEARINLETLRSKRSKGEISGE